MKKTENQVEKKSNFSLKKNENVDASKKEKKGVGFQIPDNQEQTEKNG